MFIPTNYLPAKQRVHRKRRGAPSAPPALTLVSAVYDGDSQFLTLGFDRAIDISGMDVSQLIVYDGGVMNFIYQGYNEPDLLSPTSVRVALNGIAEDPPPGEHLDAGAENGIVASDDGGTWAGCEDLSLPFP